MKQLEVISMFENVLVGQKKKQRKEKEKMEMEMEKVDSEDLRTKKKGGGI
jgi:hypothetical protein